MVHQSPGGMLVHSGAGPALLPPGFWALSWAGAVDSQRVLAMAAARADRVKVGCIVTPLWWVEVRVVLECWLGCWQLQHKMQSRGARCRSAALVLDQAPRG